jgi:MoaA/NifB/PqqE/SkfB family radical SAM enzyme
MLQLLLKTWSAKVYVNNPGGLMDIKYAAFYNDIIEHGLVSGKPVTGFFELTARCNFQCKMCYVCGMEDHSSLLKKELTTEQWIEMGRQAMNSGVLFLTLTGGEIFMRRDFWQIYEAYANMGFIITLYTNGSLLTDEMIAKLAKQPPLRVSITLYGANPQTYGNVTGHPEGFDKVVTNISKLQAAGIDVHLKTTVIKYNRDAFDLTARLARSMDLG